MNSKRFIDAYNRTDGALHARFGFKPAMSFTDAVRRAAAINSFVRRYEDDLVDYGRLRNAIVHQSDPDKAIAEPNDEVTRRFEHIAKVLCEPPPASTIAHTAVCVSPNTPLISAIAKMNENDFSIMPVTDGRHVVGVLTNKDVLKFLASNVGSVDAKLIDAKVGSAISDSGKYYDITDDCPVDDVLQAFENNRRLRMLILTDTGSAEGKVTGVITVGDLVAITKMLDTY